MPVFIIFDILLEKNFFSVMRHVSDEKLRNLRYLQ